MEVRRGEVGFFLVGDGVCCDDGEVKLLFLLFVSGSCAEGCAVGCFVLTVGEYLSRDADGGDGRCVFYRLVKSGWFLLPTSSVGLLPLRGNSTSGEPGSSVLGASDPLLSSSDAMAAGHLARPVPSTVTRRVGVSDVLLMMPLKASFPSSERWVVGFIAMAPIAGDEDDQENLVRTWM
ncbi:hypothetical protein C2845_PM02G28280 [Panicum miliaceum]|uniref:Uncharacterized protein n=1 Tax=Panicum miliaceum TaxID=4540 RepID=A0A3L6SDH4_PANMI|nr:hypothetical protein C2845_PM02G28280 [Panicum miliaceum]